MALDRLDSAHRDSAIDLFRIGDPRSRLGKPERQLSSPYPLDERDRKRRILARVES